MSSNDEDDFPEDTRELELTIHRIRLDGLWSLEDLYDFPRIYSQAYSFFYVLDTPPSLQDEDFAEPFSSHPWVGGYDAVNFYHQLQSRVPKRLRPDIVAIRYASPGWLDLSLLAGAAISIRVAVSNFAAAAERLSRLYTTIHEGMRDRKLARLDVKRKELRLNRDQLQFVLKANKDLSDLMAFQKPLKELRELTGDDLRTLKILLAHYRRIRELARFQKNGKAEL